MSSVFFFFLFFLLTVSVPPSEVVIALELGLQSEKSTRPSKIQIQVLEFAACVLLRASNHRVSSSVPLSFINHILKGSLTARQVCEITETSVLT